MSAAKTIEHTGVVKRVDNDSIIVSIIKNSGCASCEAKGSCNVSEVEEKEIEIRKFSGKYSVGEHVEVFFSESLGYRALFFGYVLPFIIVLTVLIVLTVANMNEGKAGLFALGSLIPYYLALFLTKNRQRNKFSFSIKKV
ncbi:MAG: SoxR reducing system RseC family protein [Chloroflexia bacterium]|nr:SoxR reducing system RseC family protein [Chloroflexia bacterium]